MWAGWGAPGACGGCTHPFSCLDSKAYFNSLLPLQDFPSDLKNLALESKDWEVKLVTRLRNCQGLEGALGSLILQRMSPR